MINIAALVTFLIAMIPALIMRPPFGDRKVSYRVGIYMLIVTSIAFVVPYGAAPLFFLAVALTAVFVTNRQPLAIYFAAMVYMFPAEIIWLLPFPGINYLIELNPKIVLAFMLLPALFRDKFPGSSGGVTFCVVFFVIATWVLDLRLVGQSPTNAMRALFTDLIMVVVPYLVLRKVLGDPRRFVAGVSAFGAAALFITLMAFWGFLRGWMFYTAIPLNDVGAYVYLFRDGVLRFRAATNGVETPLIAAVGGLVALWLRGTWPKGLLMYGWLAIVPFSVLLSGSRGGLLSALVLASGYIYFRYFPKGLRQLGYVAAAVGAFVVFPVVLTMDWSFIDPYGTFEYRQRLLQVSMTRIFETLWVGDANYAEHPIFEQMRQGQGIIDFVNTYVQVALGYGLVGFGTFVGMLLLSARLALKTAYAIEPGIFGDHVNARNIGFGLAATIGAHSVMIMTVSEVSHIGYFKYLLAAFAVAYAEAARKAQEEPDST
ncbi:MAG: hypothetical protein AAF608_09795 [Pseudomonadota bacterium]